MRSMTGMARSLAFATVLMNLMTTPCLSLFKMVVLTSVSRHAHIACEDSCASGRSGYVRGASAGDQRRDAAQRKGCAHQ